MSTLLDDKASCMPITNISKNDDIFLKKFSKDFYQKMIDISDFNAFENTLIKWIKNKNKNPKIILELMQKL